LNRLLNNILGILTGEEKRKLYWLTVLNIIISVLDIVSLALILVVINFYTSKNSRITAFLPTWLAQKNSATLIVVFFLFFLFKNTVAYASAHLIYRFVFSAAARLSQQSLSNYLYGSYTEHVETDSAVFIRRISHQPIEFAQFILLGVQQIITEATLIIIAMTAILLYNIKLCMIVTALLLPVTLLAWLSTQKRIKSSRDTLKLNSESALQYLKEALNGFTESNVYGKNSFFIKRYAENQRKLNVHIARLQITQAMPSRLMEVFAVFGLLLLITANILTGSKNPADIITIGAFIAAAYKIIPGLVRIINISGQINTYRFTVDGLLKESTTPRLENEVKDCPSISSFSFNDVCFSYKGTPVIANSNFKICKGQFVGIAGPSGKGKTTIVHLLLGFLKETAGGIYINGKLTSATGRKNYHRRIAYVKQQNFLINDTIHKNITLDEIEYDEERMLAVVEASGLSSFISQYDEGIGKVINENGKNISGGQRQRIAIARALYKDADVIILDEPFNELDTASEVRLLQHFKQLTRQGKIVILITHQKESLSFCDKVISLNEG